MSPFSCHSKLTTLTETQKDQAASWLLDENLSFQQAADRVKEVFGFTISKSAVYKFWHRECVPRKLLRAAETANSLRSAAQLVKTDWQEASGQLISQRVFEALADPQMDIKTVCALGGVLEKANTRILQEKALRAKLTGEKRRDKQRERQMAFAREKFEFDAVEAVLAQAAKIKTVSTDRALSSDEKREQLRRLLFPQAFGASPAEMPHTEDTERKKGNEK